MHYLINVLVKAESVTEALQNAKYGAEDMTNQEYGADFDWYNMDGRWGASGAHKVTSKKGKELLKQGMKSTREDFDRAMKTVLYMLENFSDNEIFNSDFSKAKDAPTDMYLSRYQFSVLGGSSNSCYVYAPDGEVWGGKVENPKDLDHILKSNNNLWVVPIDFHN